MPNEKQKQTEDPQNRRSSWHGFSVAEFDVSAGTLLESINAFQGQLTIMKTVISGARKRGTAAAFAHSDDPAKLDRACDLLRENVSPCLCQIESLQKGIGQWCRAERDSRRMRFQAAAEERSWHIAGDWPEVVVAGVVFIKVDDAGDKATVNDRFVRGRLTAEKLVVVVETELKELEQGKTTPDKFVRELWKAYRSCGCSAGDGVLVYDLLRELLLARQVKTFMHDPTSARFRPYPLKQFRADLTSYFAEGAPPVRSGSEEYALEFVGGSYAEHGIYMYSPQTDRLTTCGRLTFRTVRE